MRKFSILDVSLELTKEYLFLPQQGLARIMAYTEDRICPKIPEHFYVMMKEKMVIAAPITGNNTDLCCIIIVKVTLFNCKL